MSIILIRTMSSYGFRSGHWAVLHGVSVQPAAAAGNPVKHPCYEVYFPSDGMRDYWVINDSKGQYEFEISDNLSRNDLIKLIEHREAELPDLAIRE